MSDENVKAVRAMVDAFRHGEPAAVLESVDPGVVFTPLPDAPNFQTWRGREGLLEGLAQTIDIWDEFSVELRETRDLEDHVLASIRWWGRGASSGIEVEVDICALCTFRGDRIAGLRFFSSERQALEAAGLSE